MKSFNFEITEGRIFYGDFEQPFVSYIDHTWNLFIPGSIFGHIGADDDVIKGTNYWLFSYCHFRAFQDCVGHSVTPGACCPLVPHVSRHVVWGLCRSCQGNPETLGMHALILLDLNIQEHCFEDEKVISDGLSTASWMDGIGPPQTKARKV